MGDDGEAADKRPAVLTGEVVRKPPNRSADGGTLAPGGGSLNPGGRPKEERDVVELARQRGPEVIKRLFYIAMRGAITNPTTVLAAKLLLERGYGKAPLTVAGGDGRPLTDAQGKPIAVGRIIVLPAERSDDE